MDAKRHQWDQESLRETGEIAPPDAPVLAIRIRVLTLVLFTVLLLVALSRIAPIPAANALPTEEIAPAQLEAQTPVYMGGSGCPLGRGVQTTKWTAC